MNTLVNDSSVAPAARVEIVHAFAILAFLGCIEPSDLPTTLNSLHSVFCLSLPKVCEHYL